MNEDIEYDVVVSDAALSMLDNHIDFLARISVSAAEKLMDTILDDMASLANFPERFPIYRNQFIPDNRYRKMVSSKRYLIIYEVDNDLEKPTVYVDYVVDCRQDYEWMIM